MYELIFALKHIHLSKRGKRVGGGGGGKIPNDNLLT